MIFTGKNLRLVHQAIGWAIDEVHNQIATCPDVIEHSDSIEELEADKKQLEQLQVRVARALQREQGVFR